MRDYFLLQIKRAFQKIARYWIFKHTVFTIGSLCTAWCVDLQIKNM